jgi:SHS2 domain-containing protein
MSYTVTPFDHTADKGIIVQAPRLEDLFTGAAVGMFDSMYRLEGVAADRDRQVAVTGAAAESLLVAWLQELIFLFEVEDEVYLDVTVHELSETSLRATLHGRLLGPDILQIGAAVKAVTYHGLSLRRVEDGWEATLLFDV